MKLTFGVHIHLSHVMTNMQSYQVKMLFTWTISIASMYNSSEFDFDKTSLNLTLEFVK